MEGNEQGDWAAQDEAGCVTPKQRTVTGDE